MSKRIVLFTANTSGGIIQFTFQLYHVLKSLGNAVKVFIPCETSVSDVCGIEEGDLQTYHKVKSIINKSSYQEIARIIIDLNYDYIWYCDDSIICLKVGLALKKSSIKQLLSLHDAGGYHPTYHDNIRKKVLRLYARVINRCFYKNVHRFVLYSPESKKVFISRWPKYCNLTVMMNLGAHVPRAQEKKPSEIDSTNGYLLFIGRIDKYKGIGKLLEAYQMRSIDTLPLVIAGGGNLSDEEKILLNNTTNVTFINHYIDDGEMKWLFKNSIAVVLPYIEATQSGVIPIAYYYSKPVVVSNVPGLTQFVIDGKTGFICKNTYDWIKTINLVDANVCENMKKNIQQYYNENLLWENNVKRILSQL